MNVLLDACALLALASGSLPNTAVRCLAAAPEAWVSVVSPWELAIKARAGKLSLPLPPAVWCDRLCRRHNLRLLPLSLEAVCDAASLAPLHRDPFDRVLVAIAARHHLTILTSDTIVPRYPGIRTLW